MRALRRVSTLSRTGGGEGKAGDAVPGGQFDQLGGIRADLLLGRGRQVLWLGEWRAHTASLPTAVRGRNIIRSRPVLARELGLVAGLERGWLKRASATACGPDRLFPMCSRQVW